MFVIIGVFHYFFISLFLSFVRFLRSVVSGSGHYLATSFCISLARHFVRPVARSVSRRSVCVSRFRYFFI